MTALSAAFIGVPQSRYAAIAILFAIVVVSLAIIFGKDAIPMSQKFGFVLLVALVSLPSLAMALFQMTCLVTGAGLKNQRWWCSLYSWVLSAMMILYSVLLVISAIMSLSAGDVAARKESFEDMEDEEEKKEKAQEIAEMFFAGEAKVPKSEYFTDAPDMSEMPSMPTKMSGGESEDFEMPGMPGMPGMQHMKKGEGFAGFNLEQFEMPEMQQMPTKKMEGFNVPAMPMPPAGFKIQGGASVAAPAIDVKAASSLPPAPTAADVGPRPSSPETFSSFGSLVF